MRQRLLRWLLGTRRMITQMPVLLDWLLGVLERFLAASLIGLVVFGTFWLVFFAGRPLDQSRPGQILQLLDDNWKVMLILGAMVFYRPITSFLNRLRRFSVGGTTAEADAPSELDNPPVEEE